MKSPKFLKWITYHFSLVSGNVTTTEKKLCARVYYTVIWMDSLVFIEKESNCVQV